MRTLYFEGRRDGSMFGSQAGSITKWVSAISKVRQYLSSTHDATGIISEEADSHLNKAAAAGPQNASDIIRNFHFSDSDSVRSKCQTARKEVLENAKLWATAKSNYDR